MSQEQYSKPSAGAAAGPSMQQQSLQAAAAAAVEGAALPVLPQPPLSPEHQVRNARLAESLRGKLILAPLTRGGHLPFRRLCADFGAEVTMSEMAFARQLLKGDRKEAAILRRAPNETCYGVQIATNAIDEGLRAGRAVADAGADWLDLNVGCPIIEASRRGLGAIMLRKPKKLARLVAGLAAGLDIPLTVKIRLGADSNINVEEVVPLLKEAGAAAVTVHGRTMQARYKKAADWDLVMRVASDNAVPIIGNGDVLTHYEAVRRLDGSNRGSNGDGDGVHAVMVGRGALTKPWIFWEFKEGRELAPTAAERVAIYRQLVAYMKEHFGNDARGKSKAFYFLPWHFNFLARYRPLPEHVYGSLSMQQPLISTRWSSVACEEAGETLADLLPLEHLLRCENESAFGPISEALWESASDTDAVAALERLAAGELAGWEEELRRSVDDRDRGDSRQVEG